MYNNELQPLKRKRAMLDIESSRERIGQGPICRFAPGSELARERKGCESSVHTALGIVLNNNLSASDHAGWNSGETNGDRRRWVGAAWGGVCGGVPCRLRDLARGAS